MVSIGSTNRPGSSSTNNAHGWHLIRVQIKVYDPTGKRSHMRDVFLPRSATLAAAISDVDDFAQSITATSEEHTG